MSSSSSSSTIEKENQTKWNAVDFGIFESKESLEKQQPSLSSSKDDLRKSPTLNDESNVLIITNCHIPEGILEYLWAKSSIVICADGGANRLYSYFEKRGKVEEWIPDYIKGDLDSIQEAVSEFYSKKGTSIICDSSQDTTDLQKCMDLVVELETNNALKYKHIFVAGGLGGSISHEFANFNNLFLYPNHKIILVSSSNVGWYLNPKHSHLIIGKKEAKCSVIPLGCKAETVTTNGLKWNLDKQSLNFGELISTSNLTIDPNVTIESSHPLVFIFDLIENC
eukprot:gene11113-13597_t